MEKKVFIVDVDVTMSKRIECVGAKDADDARRMVLDWFKNNPYEMARSFDAYVGCEVTDVNEEKED